MQELRGQTLQDRHDAARTVEIGHVIVSRRRELADVRRARRQLVHALQREIDVRLTGNRKRMKHGVGRAAHRHVERERVVHRLLGDDLARERSALLRHLDDALGGCLIVVGTTRIDGEDGTVAGKRDAEGLVQAVHRVRREHARAAAAAGAGGLLDLLEVLGGDLARVLGTDAFEHRVEVGILAGERMLARRHRTARGEDRRDVHAQRAQQHARDDLVAVGDADERVEAVGLRDRLDRIGDQLTGRERVLHARMAHRDAVADGNRVELHRDAAGLFDALLEVLADLVEMAVTRHEGLVRVGDADERLLDVLALHAAREVQRTMRRTLLAGLDLIRNHFFSPFLKM